MTEKQGYLFNPGHPDQPPYQFHSGTSRAAAESIRPTAEAMRQRVLEYLRLRAGLGATDDEGQRDMEMAGNTYRPRRCELVEAGLVRDSGTTRPTASGRKAVVWLANDSRTE